MTGLEPDDSVPVAPVWPVPPVPPCDWLPPDVPLPGTAWTDCTLPVASLINSCCGNREPHAVTAATTMTSSAAKVRRSNVRPRRLRFNVRRVDLLLLGLNRPPNLGISVVNLNSNCLGLHCQRRLPQISGTERELAWVAECLRGRSIGRMGLDIPTPSGLWVLQGPGRLDRSQLRTGGWSGTSATGPRLASWSHGRRSVRSAGGRRPRGTLG